MKEIHMAHIVLFFIGLFMLAIALLFSAGPTTEPKQAANIDFCEFILPDGSVYIPAEAFDFVEVL